MTVIVQPDDDKPRVTKERIWGTPYFRHCIYMGRQLIYSCLSPMSDAEVAERVERFRNPLATQGPVTFDKAAFRLRRGKPGPKTAAERAARTDDTVPEPEDD